MRKRFTKPLLNLTSLALLFSVLSIPQHLLGQIPELMYFKFNGTTGGGSTVANDAPAITRAGAANATLLGLTVGGTGQFGSALQGGAGGGATASNRVDPLWTGTHTGSWTISFWCNPGTPPTTRYYFGNTAGNGTFRCFIGGAAVGVRLTGGVPTMTLDMPAFNPVNGGVVTYVYDQTTGVVSSYLNGVFQTSASPGVSYPLVGTNFVIGSQGNSIQGGMDEFRMYNRALSAADVASTWNKDISLSGAVNNASVSALVSPKNFCTGNHDVIVKIKNTGSNVINNVTVKWELNNVPQTPIIWNTPLDTFGGTLYPNDTNITLTNLNINTNYNLKVWTEFPNSLADTSNLDDTLTTMLVPAMSGAYTINPTGSGTSNFVSFTAAATALQQAGLCGPVTFDVAPGTYNEQVTLSNVAGVSSVNTITFNGTDASTRILTFSAGASYPTLTISGVPYVTVKNLTINATNATNGFGVLITGNSNGGRISNCKINVTGGSSSAANGIVVGGSTTSYSTGGRVDSLMIDSNVITGGYFGVVFYAGSAAIGLQNKIMYNQILNTYQYGVYMYYQNGMTLSNNLVVGGKFITSNYGLYCSNTSNNGINAVNISNNTVYNVGAYALYLVGSNAVGNKGRIINNKFGGGMRYGSNYLCYMSGSQWSFAHNTVHRDFATATNTYGGLYVASASGVSIMNNIFSSTKVGSLGLPLYAVNTTTIDSMNYNTFYRQDTSNNQLIYVGVAHNSGGFKGAAGFNVNSVYAQPVFANDTTLNPGNSCLSGTPIVYVPTDINGAARSVTSPSMGAVEVVKNLNDVEIVQVVKPIPTYTSGFQDIEIRIRNLGTSTVNSVNVSYTSNGGTPVTVNWTGSLAPCDTTTVTFTGANQFNLTSFHNMVFYTSAPNGVQDQNTNNDTLKTLFLLPMNGTYTVGGATADFANPKAVVNALNIAGVSGPVILNFTPNMTFPGELDLGVIPGTSATNTVTFNGNGDTLLGGVGTYNFAMNGTSYVIINNFRLIAVDFNNPGSGIYFRNASHHVTIKNNIINLGMTSTTTVAGIAFSGNTLNATQTGNNARYITIDSNEIIGGYYGISMYGEAGFLNCYGHTVSNNTIRDFYAYGFILTHVDTTTIIGNNISRPNRTTLTTFAGVYMTTSRYVKVISNRIHTSGAGSYSAYPFYIPNCVASVGYENQFINNSIYNIPTTGTIYGVYSLTTALTGAKFYHNTFYFDGNAATIRGGFFNVATSNVDIKNNIVSIAGNGTGTKHCVYVTSVAIGSGITSNNNVFHMGATAGTNNMGYIGANVATLPAWVTATSQDASSSALNPVFSNPAAGDLTPLSVNIDNIGTNVGVTTDINGTARSVTSPDAGAYEFTGISGDISIASGSLLRSGACYSTSDTVRISVTNLIGPSIDFSVNPLNIVWNVTGPVSSNGVIAVNSGTLASGASGSFFANTVNMSQPGTYTLYAYIQPNAVNASTTNDTLVTPVNHTVQPILSVAQRNFTVTGPADTVVMQANSPIFPGGAFLFTEVCHYKIAAGAPVGGWPTYLVADDYVEITGVPNSDLGGYTLEQWNTTALVSTYTFPTGTLVSPNGTAIIAVGQLGASVPVPASFYYHGNGSYTGNFDSGTTPTGRILKNSNGVIVDVVTYSGSSSYAFPVAAGVSASDWSGNTPVSTSTSGLRLNGPDINNASNWALASASAQDPNTLNSNVPLPTPGTLTGFSWNYLGAPVSSSPRTTVGPYTVPGVYTYVAVYTNVCGTFYDTVFVTATSTVPVKLLSFTGRTISTDAMLSWQTASEKNTSHFEIYASADGISFNPVGRIKAAGNSKQVLSYSFVDAGVFTKNQQMYYKLKMTDKDGTFEWSNVIELNTDKIMTKPVVNPNPFNSSLTVTLTDRTPAVITLTNLVGENVFTTTIDSGVQEITLDQVAGLKAGIYFITVTQHGVTTVSKLVKN